MSPGSCREKHHPPRHATTRQGCRRAHIIYAREEDKSNNRNAILNMLSNIRFLGRRGIPLRGDADGNNANFTQIVHIQIKTSLPFPCGQENQQVHVQADAKQYAHHHHIVSATALIHRTARPSISAMSSLLGISPKCVQLVMIWFRSHVAAPHIQCLFSR